MEMSPQVKLMENDELMTPPDVSPKPQRPKLTKEQSKWQELIGPCQGCDQLSAAVPQEEAIIFLERHERVKNVYPWENLMGKMWCGPCLKKTDDERHKLARENKAGQIRRNLITQKLLPMGFHSACFEQSNRMIELQNKDAWAWAHEWTPDSGNAWIYGNVGTGKTFMARCILNAHINERRRPVAEVTGGKWVETAVRFSEYVQHRERLQEVDLLLIEDIDKAIWTEQAFDMFFDLMNTRCDQKLRTLITTNGLPEYMLGAESGIWRGVCRGNPSKVTAVMDRLLPIKRLEFKGVSQRD